MTTKFPRWNSAEVIELARWQVNDTDGTPVSRSKLLSDGEVMAQYLDSDGEWTDWFGTDFWTSISDIRISLHDAKLRAAHPGMTVLRSFS